MNHGSGLGVKFLKNLSPVFQAAPYWVCLVLEGIPDRPGLSMGADGLTGGSRVTDVASGRRQRLGPAHGI